MLPYKLQLILFMMSIFGFAVIFYFVRSNVLLLKYSAIWLIVAILSLLMAIFPSILTGVSIAIGIQTPSNTLFLFGLVFALAILFSLTISASKNASRVKTLTQEIAILKNKYEGNKHE